MSNPARTITVTCTWESTHVIDVPEGTERIASDDIGTVIDIEDVSAAGASLTDWEITDNG